MKLYIFLAGVAVGYFGRGTIQKHLSPTSLVDLAAERLFGQKKGKKK